MKSITVHQDLRPVRFFSGPDFPPSPQELTALDAIADLQDVVQVVGLPDLHLKPQLEAPSSMAVATRENLVLGLSSPSPNCGMALFQTNLYLDDLDHRRIDDLFFGLALRLPIKRDEHVLNDAELKDILLQGAGFAVERYGLSTEILAYMDQGGNALPLDADPEQVLRSVPRVLNPIARKQFGHVGKGNHFFELQVVQAIHDLQIARRWGLAPGQIVAMVHADSGYLGAFVGRVYAHRMKNNWRGRLYEWQVKLPFQLFAGSPQRLPARIGYHFWPRRLSPIPAESEEGKRTLLALQAASNYAYANRVRVLSVFGCLLKEIWSSLAREPKMLWDAPHNSIRQEWVNEQEMWIHRHNAIRAQPPSDIPPDSPFYGFGHPLLLPGTHRTSSYLLVSREGAVNALNSADHGAGRSAQRLGRVLEDGPFTRVYGYAGEKPRADGHCTDAGVEAVIETLEAHDIARRVARLRPLAVLKAG